MAQESPPIDIARQVGNYDIAVTIGGEEVLRLELLSPPTKEDIKRVIITLSIMNHPFGIPSLEY